MTERNVEVEASLSVRVDADRPIDARSEAAQRVKQALEEVEGKTPGIAVGTSDGSATKPVVEHDYTPDLIRQTARLIHKNETIILETTEEGFVLAHSRQQKRCTFVGLRESEGVYVVAKMFKKSETIGRGDPKIQTSKNDYVECQLYRMALDTPIRNTDEQVEAIAEKIDGKEYDEKIDTGYINGYRLTALKDVLDDVFRWYEA